MRLYGLIGFPLAQSFSKKYFTEKFAAEGITDAAYELFELKNINEFPALLTNNKDLCGINVTIPYKQDVMQYLDDVHEEAKTIGAVNCIKIADGKLYGFNTDAPAFERSLKTLLYPHHNRALVLGTGGAAKAIVHVLKKLRIEYKYVSRTPKNDQLSYEHITPQVIHDYGLIINCTPLGSYPKVDNSPDIPYESLTPRHYLYDLVYNPAVTKFLHKGEEHGAVIKNGYDMLVGQAEASWEIWNG